MAIRFDAFRLDAATIQRLGSGAVRVPAVLTRSGVFEYQDGSGKVIREWRPPEEIMRGDSVASLKDLPTTERHPKGFVTPTTWKDTAIGHVSSESVRADKAQYHVAADVVISDATAIGKIGKDLKEISCGYQVRIDETPGVVPAGYPDAGKPYDRVQRDVVYNHVAIGPERWGRQGAAVSMRLDSDDNEIPPACCADCAAHTDAAFPWDDCMAKAMKEYGNEETAKKVCGAIKARNESADWRLDAAIREEREKHMLKIRIDGVDFEAPDAASLQAKIDAHFAAKNQKTDSAELEKLRGEKATLETQLAQANERADKAPELARVALAARAQLEQDAAKILGTSEKFDGKSDREIRVAAITRCDSAFKADGLSDDRIVGSFETWVKSAGARRLDANTANVALGLAGVGGNGEPKPEARVDADDPDAARGRMIGRMNDGTYGGKRGDQKKMINGSPC